MPNPLADRLSKQFEKASQTVQDLSARVLAGSAPSPEDLENGLKRLFAAVKDCAISLRNGDVQPTDWPGDEFQRLLRADVLEFWDNLAPIHLPVSHALVSVRFQSPDPLLASEKPMLGYGSPTEEPAAPDLAGSPVLLLMAGFSIEQLVLCIALHYKTGGIRRVVPFAGKLPGGGNTWNEPAREKILEGLRILGIRVASGSHVPATDHLIIESSLTVEASNPARVFQEILKWSRQPENSACRCALDVTGGQKPMDSGASYAAMYLGWPAYYLDFTDYDPQLRRPKPHSLRYARLQLPSSTFSADTRKQILELFRQCRFGRALQYVQELADFAAGSSFFEAPDREDIGRASHLIAQSDAWLRADYFHDAMSGWTDGVCPFFRAPPSIETSRQPNSSGTKRRLAKSDLRKTIEAMMNSPNVNPKQAPLLDYAVDEYWRIRSNHEAGQDCRECLVAAHGLAEVLVDGILRLQRFHLRIAKVLAAAILLPSKEPPRVLDREQVEKQLQCRIVPVHRLPPAASDEKRKVLMSGGGTFGLRIPCEIPKEEGKFNFAAIPEWLNNAQPWRSEKPFIQVLIQVTLDAWPDTAVVTATSGDMQKSGERADHWGTYKWSDLRNLTAHWRVPLGHAFDNILDRAMHQWLPRYVGLYAWAVECDKIPAYCSEADCMRIGESCLGQGQCRPWHGRLDDLRNWLQVPH